MISRGVDRGAEHVICEEILFAGRASKEHPDLSLGKIHRAILWMSSLGARIAPAPPTTRPSTGSLALSSATSIRPCSCLWSLPQGQIQRLPLQGLQLRLLWALLRLHQLPAGLRWTSPRLRSGSSVVALRANKTSSRTTCSAPRSTPLVIIGALSEGQCPQFPEILAAQSGLKYASSLTARDR